MIYIFYSNFFSPITFLKPPWLLCQGKTIRSTPRNTEKRGFSEATRTFWNVPTDEWSWGTHSVFPDPLVSKTNHFNQWSLRFFQLCQTMRQRWGTWALLYHYPLIKAASHTFSWHPCFLEHNWHNAGDISAFAPPSRRGSHQLSSLNLSTNSSAGFSQRQNK